MSTSSEMIELQENGFANLFDIDLSSIADPPAIETMEPEHPPVVSRESVAATGPDPLSGILFFDIETVPFLAKLESLGIRSPTAELPPETPLAHLPSAAEFVTQDVAAAKQSLAGKRPPDQWIADCRSAEKAAKKPRKGMFDLLDDLAEVKQKTEAAVEAWRKQMALCPETLEIVSISIAIGSEEPRVMTRGDIEDPQHVEDEETLLYWFWAEVARSQRVCGYNCINFDLPAIFARSAAYGIRPTRKIGLRPGCMDVVDLMRCRYPVGPARGLKGVTKLCGLAHDIPDVDGSDVFRLWQEDPAKLAEYNASDVRLCQRLFMHWRGLFC